MKFQERLYIVLSRFVCCLLLCFPLSTCFLVAQLVSALKSRHHGERMERYEWYTVSFL